MSHLYCSVTAQKLSDQLTSAHRCVIFCLFLFWGVLQCGFRTSRLGSFYEFAFLFPLPSQRSFQPMLALWAVAMRCGVSDCFDFRIVLRSSLDNMHRSEVKSRVFKAFQSLKHNHWSPTDSSSSSVRLRLGERSVMFSRSTFLGPTSTTAMWVYRWTWDLWVLS